MCKLLISIAAALVLGACGGSSVGSQSLFNYTPKPPGNFAFETSPSPGHAALGSENGAGPAPASQAKPSPVQQAAAHFGVKILSDLSSQAGGFDPLQFRVTRGTIIVFTNTDSKSHSVVSEGGPASFNSGLIGPGASWSYTAQTTGTFQFGDGTRPYVSAGQFTVS